MSNKLAVLIMIGGLSSRMGGGIKSFKKFNNKSIFERIIKKIQPQTNEIIINCNIEDKKLKLIKFPILKDIKEGFLGPLAGIHTGMSWVVKNNPKIEWLITIPGDTPFIPNNLIDSFKKKMNGSSKIIIVKSNKRKHPTVGAWHISLYENLEKHLNSGSRKILEWAENHPLDFLNYENQEYDPFFNINNLDDIYQAEKIEKKFKKDSKTLSMRI